MKFSSKILQQKMKILPLKNDGLSLSAAPSVARCSPASIPTIVSQGTRPQWTLSCQRSHCRSRKLDIPPPGWGSGE